jgi:hypothetical protein
MRVWMSLSVPSRDSPIAGIVTGIGKDEVVPVLDRDPGLGLGETFFTRISFTAATFSIVELKRTHDALLSGPHLRASLNRRWAAPRFIL